MTSADAQQQLAELQARPFRAHEARHSFVDPVHQRAAVKVMPGEHFVSDRELAIMTTLGSCVAVCLHDPEARVGGMNHFMLPEGEGLTEGRYGPFAMTLLIEALEAYGAERRRLVAKVFGGAQVMPGLAAARVGEQNVVFTDRFLRQAGIAVVARDVLGESARKICLLPSRGVVLCKRLPPSRAPELRQQEARYRRQLAVPASDRVFQDGVPDPCRYV